MILCLSPAGTLLWHMRTAVSGVELVEGNPWCNAGSSLPVSEWQQEAPPFRSPPGFSCLQTKARHHSQCFLTRQQLKWHGGESSDIRMQTRAWTQTQEETTMDPSQCLAIMGRDQRSEPNPVVKLHWLHVHPCNRAKCAFISLQIGQCSTLYGSYWKHHKRSHLSL